MKENAQSTRAGQKRRSGLWLGLSVPLIILGIIFLVWRREWASTGTARNVGAHIYSELLAVEPDVLSGKITDPNAPALEAIEKERDAYQKSHSDESFNDAMIFSYLDAYASHLGMIAMANQSPSPNGSADRGRDLQFLKEDKANIEKYVK